MIAYEDRLFLQKTAPSALPPSPWSIDAEVDSYALIELITSLSEEDLGRGEANMSRFLRNAMGRSCSPSLLREEGYISTIPPRPRDHAPNNRKIIYLTLTCIEPCTAV